MTGLLKKGLLGEDDSSFMNYVASLPLQSQYQDDSVFLWLVSAMGTARLNTH